MSQDLSVGAAHLTCGVTPISFAVSIEHVQSLSRNKNAKYLKQACVFTTLTRHYRRINYRIINIGGTPERQTRTSPSKKLGNTANATKSIET